MLPILSQAAAGRLDIALVRAGEFLVKTHLEPRAGLPLWQLGLGDLCERFIVERLGVPSTPFTLVDLARVAGVLPKGARP